MDGMPQYLPCQLLREQIFAFERDRRSYIIAMDPERVQVYHKYFKKYVADRVSTSHIEASVDISFRTRVWSSVMALRRNSP